MDTAIIVGISATLTVNMDYDLLAELSTHLPAIILIVGRFIGVHLNTSLLERAMKRINL